MCSEESIRGVKCLFASILLKKIKVMFQSVWICIPIGVQHETGFVPICK